MTSFDERERAFEKKFAMDEELKFRAEARRNRLLAQWAAAKLGLTGAEVDEYVKAVRKVQRGPTCANYSGANDRDAPNGLV